MTMQDYRLQIRGINKRLLVTLESMHMLTFMGLINVACHGEYAHAHMLDIQD